MASKLVVSKWSCTQCKLTQNQKTSKCEMCATKQIILSLMYKLKDNNEDVNGFCFNIIDELDNSNNDNNPDNQQDEKQNDNNDQQDEKQNDNNDQQDEKQNDNNDQQDEKQNDNEYIVNKNDISLLVDLKDKKMCFKGHALNEEDKNFTNEPCIQCNKVTSENAGNFRTKKNQKQLLSFVNKYNISSIKYGPIGGMKDHYKIWKRNGYDKSWPLHYSSICGNTKMITYLCEKDNTNINKQMTDYNNMTPIEIAAAYNQLGSLIYLIKYGANPFPTPSKKNY
eukprot:47426_1